MVDRKTLKKQKVVVVTHEVTTGMAHELRDFLRNNATEVVFLSHPLILTEKQKENTSYVERYKNGKLISQKKALLFHLPTTLLYIKDILYTLFWIGAQKGKYNIFIGFGSIDTFTGLLLKWFGKVDKVVFYVIDFVPNRFPNPIINSIHHFMEKTNAEQADSSWNLSPRMIEAREKKYKKTFPNQIVVPHGVAFDRIKQLPVNKINKHEIIYMGGLLKKQGIQLVIEAMATLRKLFPSIMFTIIGDGPDRKYLENIVKKWKVENYVTFLGYMPSHAEMEKRVAQGAVSVALYTPEKDNYTYFADPGKVKNYLAGGLPILITDVPYVAQEIEKAQCGKIIEYNVVSFVTAVKELFKNDQHYKKYRQNAIIFAKKYDWNSLFLRALAHV